MFRQESNTSLLRNLLVFVEISMMFVIVVALLSYFWNRFRFDFLEKELQIAIVAFTIFSVVLIANFILNRRW